MPARDRSNSVARTFELVGLVADAGLDGISLTALARAANLPASTCHRYVSSLLELTVLDRDTHGHLVLGVGLVTLAGRYLEDDVVRTLARPSLLRLSEASGETVHLGALARDLVVYVDKIDSEHSVRLVSRIGRKVPLYCTAMGKAILAHVPNAHRERVIRRATDRLTPRTLLGDDLRAEIDRVSTRGWAVDDQENEEGVRCLGVAILSSTGDPIGALSISGPANRFSLADCERLAPQAIAAAADIGQQISWRHIRPRMASTEGAFL